LGTARRQNILNDAACRKGPSNMHSVVLVFVWPLSRYRGKKIHDRILKVALAEKAPRQWRKRGERHSLSSNFVPSKFI
jgi:hypothetical protein